MTAPTNRRWRDPKGSRRGSVEFGGKGAGPKSSTVGGPETRWGRVRRRSRSMLRFGRRHAKVHKRGKLRWSALLFWVGLLALVTSLWLFEGTVSTGVAAVGTGAVVGSGIARHHEHTKLTRRNPNVYNPSWRERRDMEDARRNGPRSTGQVPVAGHSRDGDRVKPHTRGAPGQGSSA